MSILKTKPIDNMYILENNNNIVLLTEKGLQTRKVYAVFDGDLSYSQQLKAFKLDSKRGFVAYYKEVSGIDKTITKRNIKALTPIMRTKEIPLKGIQQVRGLYFWIEKNGKKVDPIPYLLQINADFVTNKGKKYTKKSTNKSISTTKKQSNTISKKEE